jgi:hypothetical protein
MVFSVIGDSNSFVPSPWPKAVLQTGLIEAAKNGGGTIYHFFVVKLTHSCFQIFNFSSTVYKESLNRGVETVNHIKIKGYLSHAQL